MMTEMVSTKRDWAKHFQNVSKPYADFGARRGRRHRGSTMGVSYTLDPSDTGDAPNGQNYQPTGTNTPVTDTSGNGYGNSAAAPVNDTSGGGTVVSATSQQTLQNPTQQDNSPTIINVAPPGLPVTPVVLPPNNSQPLNVKPPVPVASSSMFSSLWTSMKAHPYLWTFAIVGLVGGPLLMYHSPKIAGHLVAAGV